MQRRSLLAATSLLFAPAIVRAAAPPQKIRIAVPSQIGPTGRPENGTTTDFIDRFLQAEFPDNPKVEWAPTPGAGPGINEALAGNDVQFAIYGDFPAIVGRAGNLATRLVVPATRANNSYLLVPPTSVATSIADLRGKRLGINKGRPWMLAFSRLLTSSGLAERDFQIFNLSPGDAAAAMASGNLEAVYQPEPFGYALEESGIGKIIWSTRDRPLTYKFTSELFATTAFEEAFPDLTQRIATSFVKGAYYASLSEHRDEISQQHVTAGADRKVIDLEFAGIPWSEVINPVVDPFLRAHYKDAVAYMVEQKLIRHAFDTDAWIDAKYADTALAALKLGDVFPRADAEGKKI